MEKNDVEENQFENWVSGAKGLQCLQEGLRDFVKEKAIICRDQLLKGVLAGKIPNCNLCTSQNLLPEHADEKVKCKLDKCVQRKPNNCFGIDPRGRRKCPNGICSNLYDAIVCNHRYRDPFWKNTDPTTWCSDPLAWSFVKCFQTTPGPGNSVEKTDASGLLSFIINNLQMETWLACPNMGSDTACLFYKARDIRNAILHKSAMTLEKNTLNNYLNTFIDLLEDAEYLKSYDAAKSTVCKLKQLKSKEISHSQNDIKGILKLRKEALSELEEKKVEVMQEIEETKDEVLNAIQTDVTKRKSEALTEIKKRKSEVLTEIITDVKKRKIEIAESTNSGVNELKEVTDNMLDKLRQQQQMPITLDPGPLPVDHTELKEDLVTFYRSQHTNMPLSPLTNQRTPLLNFYVTPELVEVSEMRRHPGKVKEEKVPLESFRHIFYSNDKLHSETYVTADAGFGKTALSKRLALAWCETKSPKENERQYFTGEELGVMEGFNFVFLLLLRDCPDECEIDQLIMQQIISRLSRSAETTLKDLENILHNEPSLVILDGLDEWTHPQTHCCVHRRSEMPHRKVRENMSILTTTRPWKLNAVGMETCQFYKKLEIKGLTNESANRLKVSVLSHFMFPNSSPLCQEDSDKLDSHVKEFTKAVAENHDPDLESNPLLLMYMLFLWHYEAKLGRTQCELYMNLVELLLSRADKMYLTSHEIHSNIPICFNALKHVKLFFSQLTALGKLAFETLINEAKDEYILVFDSSVAEECLGHDCLALCLNTGLITQSQVAQTKVLQPRSNVSFTHKTMQEFLAALYMHVTRDNATKVMKSKCRCIKDILKMSKLFMFITGINADVSADITRESMKNISEDAFTQKFRSSAKLGTYKNSLKELQNLYISCCKEVSSEKEVSICLQDVFIDESCVDECYRENLKRLTEKNRENIKTLCIEMTFMCDTPYNSVHDIAKYFTFNSMANIEKVHCQGGHIDENILPLLNAQLRVLTLSSSLPPSTIDHSLCENLIELRHLEAINLNNFEISHNELKSLYDFISQRTGMRQVTLENLRCPDYETSGDPEMCLDLSQHSRLQKLTLRKAPLSELKIDMTSLEKCRLVKGGFCPQLILKSLSCGGVNEMNLNERSLKMRFVTMSTSVLNSLLNIAKNIAGKTTIKLEPCVITTEGYFKHIKDRLETSPHFRLLKYTIDREYRKLLVTMKFETVKLGDKR